jgi:carbon-monoxide dehydrogenase medium subunit
LRPFDYHAPRTLPEAVALLRELGEFARPIAGGTDLVVQMKEGGTRFPYPDMVVSLAAIDEMRAIEFDPSSGLRIGATARLADIAASPDVRSTYAALAEGAGIVGSIQTMNMGTIGGNVCNAAPSADTAPALLIYEAEAVIAGREGRRNVPVSDFFRGPGQTVLEQGELLAEIRLPVPPPGTGAAYQRHTPRKQMDIAVVGVAASLTLVGGAISRALIGLGAVAPTPVRATQAETLLVGREPSETAFAEAAQAAPDECSPIDDIRGSADFRRHLARVMTERMLAEAARRAR